MHIPYGSIMMIRLVKILKLVIFLKGGSTLEIKYVSQKCIVTSLNFCIMVAPGVEMKSWHMGGAPLKEGGAKPTELH
jgi:hypothetical protein